MKLLGKFTKKIYSLYEKNRMEECGVQITDEQAMDDEFIAQHHACNLLDCLVCCGCQESQKGKTNG